jgi:hypothetical protein
MSLVTPGQGEHLAVGQRDDRGVPAAVGHLTAGLPGVARAVVDAAVLEALELHDAVRRLAGDAGLLVVGRAADVEDPAVGQEDLVGAEQVAVVALLVVVVQRPAGTPCRRCPAGVHGGARVALAD